MLFYTSKKKAAWNPPMLSTLFVDVIECPRILKRDIFRFELFSLGM